METVIKSQNELDAITDEAGNVSFDGNLTITFPASICGDLSVGGYLFVGVLLNVKGNITAGGYIKSLGDIYCGGVIRSEEGYIRANCAIYARGVHAKGCIRVFKNEELLITTMCSKSVCATPETIMVNGVKRTPYELSCLAAHETTSGMQYRDIYESYTKLTNIKEN